MISCGSRSIMIITGNTAPWLITGPLIWHLLMYHLNGSRVTHRWQMSQGEGHQASSTGNLTSSISLANVLKVQTLLWNIFCLPGFLTKCICHRDILGYMMGERALEPHISSLKPNDAPYNSFSGCIWSYLLGHTPSSVKQKTYFPNLAAPGV